MSFTDSRERASRTAGRAVALAVMGVGTTVLVGWLFNLPTLKHIHPDWVSMVPNTALSLLGLGWVLWRQSAPVLTASSQAACRLLALLVMGLAALSLLQNLVGLDLGLDQLLFTDDTRTAPGSNPGRMAPITSICLMLCSLALLLGRVRA